MTPEEFEKLNQKHPYLTYVKFMDEKYIGIVHNIDNQMISIYVYNNIPDNRKKVFLDLGKLWWEQSNRMIPIDIFLRNDFQEFKPTLKCLPRKEIQDIFGYTVDLDQNFQKRIKRKRIQLIRNTDLKKKS